MCILCSMYNIDILKYLYDYYFIYFDDITVYLPNGIILNTLFSLKILNYFNYVKTITIVIWNKKQFLYYSLCYIVILLPISKNISLVWKL